MNDTIPSLFNDVSELVRQYEEKARKSGENYNVFWILNLSSAEVRTHSAFLTDLLNPRGWHEQKETFLKLFIEQLIELLNKREHQSEKNTSCPKFLKGFEERNPVARKEISIGDISEDKDEGGRIDICITDTTGIAIIIENKIYAADGNKQLQRYHAYGEKKHPKGFVLLYLTLFGDEPSQYSKNSIDKEDYVCISYHSFIKNWLEKCEKKASNHLLLKSTITQYLNLIKYLTHQTINEEMAMDIAKIISGKTENLKAAFAIQKSMPQVRQQIIRKFNDYMDTWATKNSLIMREELTHKEYSKVWIYRDHWQSKICLSFYKTDFKEFWIGVGKGFDEQYEAGKEIYRDRIFEDICRLSHFTPYDNPNKEKYIWLGFFSNEIMIPKDWTDNAELWSRIMDEDDEFYSTLTIGINAIADILENTCTNGELTKNLNLHQNNLTN